jgi:hypothetical protein
MQTSHWVARGKSTSPSEEERATVGGDTDDSHTVLDCRHSRRHPLGALLRTLVAHAALA